MTCSDTRDASKFRVEEDALGNVEVPVDHLWGAQTERSHLNFPIGVERYRWGRPVIRALGILKKCAAQANGELGQLPREKVDLIARAAQEVIDGKLDGEFPLVVFQTGSGMPTNMKRPCPQTPIKAWTQAWVIAWATASILATIDSPTGRTLPSSRGWSARRNA